MIDIVTANFDDEKAKHFLTTQAAGVFFETEPMCWYGDTPLAFAASFGLRDLIKRMLATGLISTDEGAGQL